MKVKLLIPRKMQEIQKTIKPPIINSFVEYIGSGSWECILDSKTSITNQTN